MMFWQKKQLWESDPKTLTIEALSTLHAALTAKLLLANEELCRRMISLEETAKVLPSADSAIFARRSAELVAFNKHLTDALAQSMGRRHLISASSLP